MSISIADIWQSWPRAVSVRASGAHLEVVLRDGRELRVPLDSFEFLEGRTDAERAGVTLDESGDAIWWETIDESLSVPGLFGLPEIPPPDPRIREYTIDYESDDGGWTATVRGTDLAAIGNTLLLTKRNARRLLRDYLGVKDLARARVDVVDVLASPEVARVR
jgi:hypothetical protein